MFNTFRARIYLPQYSSYSYFYQNASLYKVWIYNLWRSLSKQICNRQSRHVQMVKHLVRNIEHYTHTNPKKVLTFVIIILQAHTRIWNSLYVTDDVHKESKSWEHESCGSALKYLRDSNFKYIWVDLEWRREKTGWKTNNRKRAVRMKTFK